MRRCRFICSILFLVLLPTVLMGQTGATGRTRGTTTTTYTLDISTTPANAQIYIDNIPQRGRSFNLNAGTYTVRATAPGFNEFTTSVNLNQNQDLNVVLQPTQFSLIVNSNIQGALVYVNNEQLGLTNFTTRLDPGTYQVQVSVPGFVDFSTSVNLNQDQTITANLTSRPASVSIKIPDQLLHQQTDNPSSIMTVIVDNRRVSGNSFLVEPGQRNIEIRMGSLVSRAMYTFESGNSYTIEPSFGMNIIEEPIAAADPVPVRPAEPLDFEALSGWWLYRNPGQPGPARFLAFESTGNLISRTGNRTTQAGNWRFDGNTLVVSFQNGASERYTRNNKDQWTQQDQPANRPSRDLIRTRN